MNFEKGRTVLGLPERKSEATAGELREPITFVRSSRVPDTSTGFVQTFTRFAKGWAKKRFGMRKLVAGENADLTAVHLFTVRYPGFEPALTDFICWGKQLFKVHSSRIAGDRNEFLVITTTEHANTDSAPFTIVDPPEVEGNDPTSPAVVAEPVAPPAANTTRAQNSFWEDAPEAP